ncbi:MAG TPA: hypothetical protein VN922_10040 [Bacteroidia bacterium]|nr:hypothetical protein [Bacteroidia bacterium]
MKLFLSRTGNKQNPKNTILIPLSICALLILSFGFTVESSVHQFVAAQPLITNISNKGIYKVQLGLSPGVSLQSLPGYGFSPSIRFMSGAAQPATSKTIPNNANGGGLGMTVGGSGTQYNVPGSILRIVPIKSFDVTIYDSHGKVLWNIGNQKPSGGLKLVHIVFPKGTSGPITIAIHNIKSPRPNVPTDSVDFAAKVV